MPKPSKQRTAIGLISTAILFLTGAWCASLLDDKTQDISTHEPIERRAYIPAPVTGLAEPGSPSTFKEGAQVLPAK